MAFKPTELNNFTAADANYPYGSSKDETSPGAGDGSEYKKIRADDILGFQQWLLTQASIIPSGNADNVLVSQYGQALLAIISSNLVVSAQIQPITATTAANAMTSTIKAGNLDFRKADLTDGESENIEFSDLPLVIPQGATLGLVSGIESEIINIVINDGGDPHPAVVNLSGGNDLSETGLITTVAIDATADSADVFYSDAVYTSAPYRIAGSIKSTQTTAGDWAQSLEVQGAGGQSMLKVGLNAQGDAPIFACRAWVSFDATGVVAIHASGNVSSVTDGGVGIYTVNFITAMVDDKYAFVGSTSNETNANMCVTFSGPGKTASGVLFKTVLGSNASAEDRNEVTVSIFR